MTKIYAVAIHTIHYALNGIVEVLEASTKDSTTIFETNEEDLAKLESFGAARRASDAEVTLHEAAVAKANGLVQTSTSGEPPAPPKVETPATPKDGEPPKVPEPAKSKRIKDDDI